METRNLFDPPWDQPAWKAEVVSWIKFQLSKLDLNSVSQPETVHARPWSTVLKITTNHGNLFFKAGGPTQKFEPALLGVLNEHWGQHTLPLLGADLTKGWSLLPDGGPTLRQELKGKPDFEAWREILQQYAEMQITAVQWRTELKNARVPERFSEFLMHTYTEILNDPELTLVGDGEDFLTAEQHKRLIALASTVAEMFQELDSFQIPLSLEHGDLHDANVFAHPDYKIYDWGDASIAHPFFTLLLPIRRMADKLAISEYADHPELAGLVDTYLKPWERFADKARLLEAWNLAHHLAKFARTINWFRVVKSLPPALATGYQSSVTGWLLEFLDHPTDRFAS